MKQISKFIAIIFMMFLLFACAGGEDNQENISDNEQLEITDNVPDPKDIDDDKDGYTENQGDCNDNNKDIHPKAKEICGDDIDQDCDGKDLKCTPDSNDIDDDKDGYTENQGDCNDNNKDIHPKAKEICGDGIDQDCDGKDLTCTSDSNDPKDIDDDKDGYTENQGDCNDNNKDIHPKAKEICGDGIDQDCDGKDLKCETSNEDEQNTDNITFNKLLENFVISNEKSLNEEDIDLFMSNISMNSLDNGMTYDCQREIKNWVFNFYDFANTKYKINEVSYQNKNGNQLALINRTISYDQVSANGEIIKRESTEDITLVFEDNTWKFFGNQKAYSIPEILELLTCESVNMQTGEPVEIKKEFTSIDKEFTVFVRLDNIGNGTGFSIKVYKPDGTLFRETPYFNNWGDYPACARSEIQWNQSYSFILYSEYIPGFIGTLGPEAVGTWRIELSMDSIGVLGETYFKYQYTENI
ncbi:Putative metal-binding motif-containing protein [Desulfonema limicola]|uniref:Metal-binding motif-containing protein n=1 Tax=Desulfonema limicola TaxID=45656 RepID=A0A975B7X3_9BACT|nr:putative metal-binding motif-containing protein [Desulfonema limicola]QTA80599.1 Putative metal-binding motif-containing protein [Desulfonema limicola]